MSEAHKHAEAAERRPELTPTFEQVVDDLRAARLAESILREFLAYHGYQVVDNG